MKTMSRLNKEKPYSFDMCRGFTLLEVMIAIAILAVTLTVLYGSQSQSLSLATEAKFNTTAAFLSELKLAELEGGVTELNADEGDFEDFSDFHWKIEVEDAIFDEPEALQDLEDILKQVRLTISWSSSSFSHTIIAYIREEQ
jgi:general secretion pathway protein I